MVPFIKQVLAVAYAEIKPVSFHYLPPTKQNYDIKRDIKFKILLLLSVYCNTKA